MLHTKFRGNLPTGTGEEGFRPVLPYHMTKMPRTKFLSPYPRRLHIKFGFDRPTVSEKKMFEHCERRTDGIRRRTPDAGP